MLNGSPLNAAPINGLAGTAVPGPVVIGRPARPTPAAPSLPGDGAPPGYVAEASPPGFSFRWRLQVLVGDVDVSDLISGTVEIDREEGAAGIAQFALYYPPDSTVPTDMLGEKVLVNYITETGGVTTSARRYTGFVAEPAWDTVSRLMSIDCSDRLQFRVEALSVAEVDALVGGYWSADVFEPVEGRSRWDYALERLSTLPASLECSREGELRVTSWFARPPAFVFAEGSTIFQSVRVDLAQLSAATNRVEIEYSYRYSRLWQLNQSYSWDHPGTGGTTGLAGLCNFRDDSSELPTLDMILSATEQGGMTLLAGAEYYMLPPTHPDPCGTGAPWINNVTDLVLGASWKGGRRWVQTVTEIYRITLATAAGEAEGSQTVNRENGSFEVESAQAGRWANDPFTSGTSINISLRSEPRRAAALECVIRRGHVLIVGAHRATTGSWEAPTSMALDCDLAHTIELRDQGTEIGGKCRRLVDTFDLESGSAITTISVAVMRGGGASDPLVVPAAPNTAPSDPGGGSAPGVGLPTQLGRQFTSGEYDDELDGFAGNYDLVNDFTLPTFPRRLTIPVAEIPADRRDELEAATVSLIRVGIPNDLLEL